MGALYAAVTNLYFILGPLKAFISESASAIHLYKSEKAFPSYASGEVHYIIHTQILHNRYHRVPSLTQTIPPRNIHTLMLYHLCEH